MTLTMRRLLLAATALAPFVAPTRSWAQALSWPNPTLTVAVLGTTVDLGAPAQSSTDTWLSGPLAVQRRVDVPVPGDSTGTMHLVADITCFSDGHVTADVQFRRDLSVIKPATGTAATFPSQLAPLSYSATLTLNGTATTQAVANQNQYQDWHIVLNGAAVNVQHDVAGLISAGLVPPYALTLGIANTTGSQYATEAANVSGEAGFGTPLAVNDVEPAMETTGGRPDIGITTGAVATWLMTQDDTARRYALAQADTGGAIPWHHWVASTARWADDIDYPNLWTDNRSGPGNYSQYLANPVPATDTTNTPSTQPWQIATSHMPNLDYIPALLTGSRYYGDMELAQATGAMDFDYVPNRESTNDVVFGGVEVREVAWQLREVEEANALAAPGSTTKAHLAQMLSDSWAWLNASGQLPAWTAAQGAIGTYIPDRNAPGMVSPWQQDYFISALYMADELGDTPAAAVLQPMMQTRIGSLLPHAGWNRRNGVTYEWFPGTTTVSTVPAAGSTAAGPQLTTWADLQNAQVRNGQDNPSSFADTGGDYASLARESLALWLRLTPGDTNAVAALNWVLGSGAPYINAAEYQGSTMQEAVALPAGISSAGTTGTADPGGYGDTGGTADPGYVIASNSSGTSSSSATSSSTGTTAATTTSTTTTGSATGSTTSSAGTGSVTPASPVLGAVAEYTFASASGSLVSDLSGNGNTGTLAGAATIGQDAYGSYLHTTTGADYLDLGASAVLTPATFSISALVDMTSSTGVRALYGSFSGSGGIEFRVNDGTLQLLRQGLAQVCAGTSTVPTNTLVQVGVTYNGATCTFYQAGAAAGSASATATFAVTDETVGTAISGNEGLGASGRIYRLGVWNRVLTAAEMASEAGATAASASSAGTTTSSTGTVASSTGTAASSTGTTASGTGTSASGTGTTTSTGPASISAILSSMLATTSSSTGAASSAGTASLNGVALPYPAEPLAIGIGGLHVLTANGAIVAGASSAITLTAANIPATCTPPTEYYVVGARTGSQAAGAGRGGPGYCNDSGQVVLTATGLAPSF